MIIIFELYKYQDLFVLFYRYYHNDYLEQAGNNCSQVSSLVKAISLDSKKESSKVLSRKITSSNYDGLAEVCKTDGDFDRKSSNPLTPLKRLQDTLRASIDLMSRRVDEKFTADAESR